MWIFLKQLYLQLVQQSLDRSLVIIVGFIIVPCSTLPRYFLQGNSGMKFGVYGVDSAGHYGKKSFCRYVDIELKIFSSTKRHYINLKNALSPRSVLFQ